MKRILYSACLISMMILMAGCTTPPPEPVQEPVIQPPVPTPAPTPDPTPTPERPYYIEIIPREEKKESAIHLYSFIHSFYSFVFYDFDLTSLIPFDERIEIMNTVYHELPRGSQVNFVIKKYLNVDKLSFVFFTEYRNGDLLLHCFTNYDKGAEVLIPLDMPKEEWKRCVSASYYIIDTKLVHLSNLYSIKKQTDLSKAREYVELAHLYVFDEKQDNDEAAEILLKNIITKNTNARRTLRASCELAYFYFLHNRIQEGEEVIEKAETHLEGPQTKKSIQMYEMLVEEMEITKKMMN